MPKICFVESQSYAVLGAESQLISTGGESVQHTLLAREFAAQGWEVSIVSKDMGQTDGDIIDGVQVWKTFKQGSGLPVVRFMYPRMYKSWRALVKANADIYFQSCAGMMTGLVAHHTMRNDRAMIFRVAHDTDCIPGEQLVRNNRDRRMYEYGLRRTGLVSVQSDVQAKALRDNYDLESALVNMVAEMPEEQASDHRDIDILWVNNFRAFKRPELIIDVARKLPQFKFTIIGGRMRGEGDLFDSVKSQADELPNVDFVGGVPYCDVNGYFDRAKVFLNTSDSEGFPNSFLQALVRRVPIVTFFDPDGLIQSLGMGVAVVSQEQFHGPLEEILTNAQQRAAMGERGRAFVMERYSPRAIVDHYEELIDEKFGIRLNGG